ncbi:MAG: GIY-YIG nuclease family protein [Candidatus Omnitrophica bacterium]|nr:GIY-YIG nuclease family protein [Candidatus Omnitrophota bacterium]
MFYVYVLQSLKDNKWYTGSTQDISRRLEEHNSSRVASTRRRVPFKIIYYLKKA